MYRNFIFDLYGTLIDIRTDEKGASVWRRYAAWLKDRGICYEWRELRERYLLGDRQMRQAPSKFQYPEIDIIPLFQQICRDRKEDITDREVWDAGEMFRRISTEYLRLYPNTLRVLSELHAQGRRVFLLSNAQRVYTQRELVQTGLNRMFDDIFISSDYGCMKPDPAYMDILLKKHRLLKDESIMIGNEPHSDIACANASGIDAVLVQTSKLSSDINAVKCNYIFEDGDIGHTLSLLGK